MQCLWLSPLPSVCANGLEYFLLPFLKIVCLLIYKWAVKHFDGVVAKIQVVLLKSKGFTGSQIGLDWMGP